MWMYVYVRVCVYVCLQGYLISSGVVWNPYDWLSKGYCFYMAAAVPIGGRHGIKIKACRGNQPNKRVNHCCISY